MQSQLKEFFNNLEFATKNLDLFKIDKIIKSLKKVKSEFNKGKFLLN